MTVYRRNRLIAWLLAMLAALGVTVVVVNGGGLPAPSFEPTAIPTLAALATATAALTLVPTVPALVSGPPAQPTPMASTGPSGAEPWGPFPTTGLQNRPEPDPLLTPGVLSPDVSDATLSSTICQSGWTSTIRPPSSYTTALKVQQITQYGYTDILTGDYEEDHLISLELGGSPTDAGNLWPEPYTASLPDGTPAGARIKDRIESALKRAVCAGSMKLADAQHAIATDWVAAWYAAGQP